MELCEVKLNATQRAALIACQLAEKQAASMRAEIEDEIMIFYHLGPENQVAIVEEAGVIRFKESPPVDPAPERVAPRRGRPRLGKVAEPTAPKLLRTELPLEPMVAEPV